MRSCSRRVQNSKCWRPIPWANRRSALRLCLTARFLFAPIRPSGASARGAKPLRSSLTVMDVQLAYGQGHLTVDLPKAQTTVIEPSHNPGVPEERAAVLTALENPIGAPPLRQWIQEQDRVCIR